MPKKPSKSINVTVTAGYLMLIAVLLFSGWYIQQEMMHLLSFDEEEMEMNARRRAVNVTLSNLYQLEAIGQSLSVGQLSDYPRYREAMQSTLASIDTLKSFSTDTLQWLRIDSISLLLQQKQHNISSLLRTQRSARPERIYQVNIERILAQQDSIINEQQIQYREIINRDTVVTHQPKKNFFKRLAEAFSPHKEDSTFTVNTSSTIVADTIYNAFNKADSVVAIFRNIQEEVEIMQREMESELLTQTNRLRINSERLSTRINQLLQDFEQEEDYLFLQKAERQKQVREQSIRTISAIATSGVILSAIFLLIIWRDLSRSNRYRRELEAANLRSEELLQAREQLMLTITHDFKAPLGSIIGYTDLLTRLAQDGRQQFYLDSMKSSSELLLKLVNSLLDFHRLDMNKAEVDRVSFNPDELLREITTSFTPIAQGKGLELRTDIDPELNSNYISDPIRIRQVTDNLLSNALKFTQQGGVTIKARFLSRQLVLSIADTGPGMSREDTEKIFREFTRLSGAQGEEGFGLGLSIVKKLVTLLEGRIEVSSIEGKGSIFTVILPLYPVKRAQRNTPIPKKDPEPARERSYRIILIDDDPIQLRLTATMLEKGGHQVVTCYHPEELISRLRLENFDFLLTDVQMPAMNGFDLLKLLRCSNMEQSRTIPVIAVTARSDMSREDFRQQGFFDCLHKPFSLTDILHILHREACEEVSALPEKEDMPDFSALLSFSAEDREASDKILETFISETYKNRALMEEAQKKENRNELDAVSHKMLPLFKLIGAVECARILSRLEKTEGNSWTEDIRHETATLLEKIDRILKEAEQYKDKRS